MNLKALTESGEPFVVASLPAQNDVRDYRIYRNTRGTDFYLRKFDDTKSAGSVHADQQAHMQLVRDAVSAIAQGECKKIVASRIKFTKRKVDIDETFDRLKTAYPQCFVYVTRTPDGEIWMGATPELLLQKRGNQYLTVALAGTQKRIEGLSAEQYVWGEKEKSEQRMVTEYIEELLIKNNCGDIRISEPFTVIAGPVAHIKTTIKFTSALTSTELAEKLHPTPAVCGVPKNKALEFISEHEQHDRSYYAGVIGFAGAGGDADLFVNLRCMRIQPDGAELFVGGGITADSNPLSEWEETENKSQALIRYL